MESTEWSRRVPVTYSETRLLPFLATQDHRSANLQYESVLVGTNHLDCFVCRSFLAALASLLFFLPSSKCATFFTISFVAVHGTMASTEMKMRLTFRWMSGCAAVLCLAWTTVTYKKEKAIVPQLVDYFQSQLS